jgi:hypothetical protein
VLRIRDVLFQIRIRPSLHPGSGSRIRGIKKHRIRIRNTESDNIKQNERKKELLTSMMLTAMRTMSCFITMMMMLRRMTMMMMKRVRRRRRRRRGRDDG